MMPLQKNILMSAVYAVCLVSMAHAQTFSEDLEKVKSRFNGNEPFKATVEVRYYKLDQDEKPSMVKHGLIKRWGPDHYYSSMDGKEYLINKKYTLLVDRSRKLIVIKNTTPSPNQNKELSVPEISKREEQNHHISRTVSGDKVTYTVTPKNNTGKGFKMELDKQGSRLLRIIYYGGNTYARTEISYRYPEAGVSFSSGDFSETRYVNKQQNSFTPAGRYAGYEINNQTR